MKYFKDINSSNFKFYQTCNTKYFLEKKNVCIPGALFFQ